MSQRPTIADIARGLGVSPSTVSRALRDHPGISDARKQEVRAAAEAAGLDLRAGPPESRAGLVGCVVPGISHPFFAQVVEMLELVCAQSDCELILHISGGSPATEESIVRSLAARRVDGVIFVPATPASSALDECVEVLRTVVVTQQTSRCPSIGVSHEEGGRQVAEHFMELGRSSCLLVGPRDDPKFLGFRSLIEARRLTGFRVDAVEVDGWDERLSLGAYKAMLSRFDASSIRQYDSLFGFNDLAAVGALHALADLGRKVPGDVAVCGFDDIPLAREMQPGLTSVAQPVGQIVRAGFSLLQRLIRGEAIPAAERSFSLKPHLVVRASTFPGP
jgi:LacI family transcriptional regulator